MSHFILTVHNLYVGAGCWREGEGEDQEGDRGLHLRAQHSHGTPAQDAAQVEQWAFPAFF